MLKDMIKKLKKKNKIHLIRQIRKGRDKIKIKWRRIMMREKYYSGWKKSVERSKNWIEEKDCCETIHM